MIDYIVMRFKAWVHSGSNVTLENKIHEDESQEKDESNDKNEVVENSGGVRFPLYTSNDNIYRSVTKAVTSIINGKESIQAIGDPKYLLSKDDLNSLINIVMIIVTDGANDHIRKNDESRKGV